MSAWVLAVFLLCAATIAVVVFRRLRAGMHRRLERERARIAQDLHDELGSGLGSIGILAGLAAQPEVDGSTRRELAERIASGADDLGTTLTDIVWSLRPDANSVAALAAHLVERGAQLFPGEETLLITRLPETWPPAALSLEARRSLQAIAVEALHNAARHAQARHVEFGLAPGGRGWRLWVEDDGRGMPEAGAASESGGGHGRGLANMRRRAKEIGAAIAWTARPGGGTRLEVEFESASAWQARPGEAAVALQTVLPPWRLHTARDTGLYGREAELSRLDEQFQEARAGRGRVVLIEGEAGIGKTRLIDEFATRLRRSEVSVRFLYGSYPPGGAAMATNAFAQAYREHLGEARLEELLRHHLADTPTLVPAFAALLRGLSPPPGAAALTKDAMHTLFANLTYALALEAPTIVVIDDLHFAPEDGRALFAALALTVPGQRVLLAGTMRPEMSPAWIAGLARLEHLVQLSVRRLDMEDREQLINEAYESASLPPEHTTEIATRSDGNPFFALELIRELRDGGRLTHGSRAALAARETADSHLVPERVQDLIATRLSNLPAEDRDLLELASCWGFEFDPKLIAAASGRDVMSTLKRCTRVEREYLLIRQRETTYAFDHHQVQEALYEHLLPPLRKQYHAALAHALEDRERIAERELAYGDGPVAVQLADHLLEGGEGTRALRYLDVALDHLKVNHAVAALVGLAQRALDVPELPNGERRMDVYFRLGEELEALGRFDESRATFEEGLRLARSLDNARYAAKAHRRLGVITARTGHMSDAIPEFEQSRDLAHEAEDYGEESLALGNLAMAHATTGRHIDAIQEGESMLALARVIGDRVGEVRALGIVARFERDMDRAVSLSRQALEIAETLSNKEVELNALSDQAHLLVEARRPKEAKECIARALVLARETGHRVLELHALCRLADISFLDGEFGSAVSINENVLKLAERSGHRVELCQGLLGLVQSQLAVGRFAAALEHALRARSVALERGLVVFEVLALHGEGEAQCKLGLLDQAVASLTQSQSMAAAAKTERVQVDALSILGKTHEQAGNFEQAASVYGEALIMAKKTNLKTVRAPLLVDLGGLLAEQGRELEAREHLDTAISLAEELDLPEVRVLALVHRARLREGDAPTAAAALAACEARLRRWDAMLAHFVLWEATGDRSQLEAGHDILDELVAQAPESYRPRMIANVALHRRIDEAWRAMEERQEGGSPSGRADGDDGTRRASG